MFRFLIRLLYLPLFLIGGNGLALYIVEAGYSKVWLAVLVLAFLLERAVPFDRAFNKSHGDRVRDFYHALFNEASNVICVALAP